MHSVRAGFWSPIFTPAVCKFVVESNVADRAEFRDDDGSPDPTVRAALLAGRIELNELAKSRVLLALLPNAEDMSMVFMVNGDGRRGLLAFTGMDALTRWQADARPMPVRGSAAAQVALDEDAALVLDVLGPARTVLDGSALELLAGTKPGPIGDG